MASLRLSLLGSLRVMVGDAPATFESDTARSLLAYLAVESDQPHRREALVGLLWPDSPEDIARRNLRQTLYALRQAIGDHTAQPPYLLISRGEIQFNTATNHSLDVATFEALLAACDAHPHENIESCLACAERLRQAVNLYRGEFLAQFFLDDSAAFEEWPWVQRERLHRRALDSLTQLADYYSERLWD
ncbi:MAG: winged helix-turn-helix domain-containing protein [Anaerolineae bacterium]|nr:winged helix-turn-helix domain-containing protein [Anaerolineae bacterium]